MLKSLRPRSYGEELTPPAMASIFLTSSVKLIRERVSSETIRAFENVTNFQYSRATLRIQNCIHKQTETKLHSEIPATIQSRKFASIFAVHKYEV
jgi:hypothetical protein